MKSKHYIFNCYVMCNVLKYSLEKKSFYHWQQSVFNKHFTIQDHHFNSKLRNYYQNTKTNNSLALEYLSKLKIFIDGKHCSTILNCSHFHRHDVDGGPASKRLHCMRCLGNILTKRRKAPSNYKSSEWETWKNAIGNLLH